jgi:LEA14-like dessication related protein
MRTGLLLAIPFLFALGCAKPEPPTLTPKSATITAVSPAGLDLRLELQADNPNTVDLDAQKVVADVTLDGTVKLGTVTIPTPVHLPAKKSTTLTVPVRATWTNLLALAPIAQKRGEVPFSVDGKVTVGGALEIDVPFHLEGKMTPAQLAELARTALPKIPGLPF